MRDKPNLKKAKIWVISWNEFLENGYPVKPGGCEFVTTESINQCLARGHFEDARVPQTKASHHAARIAWLIKYIIETGNTLDPIHIHVSKKKAYVFDGSHRLRAYQYLHRDNAMPVLVTGRRKRLNK